MRNFKGIVVTVSILIMLSPGYISAQRSKSKTQGNKLSARELFVQGSELSSEGFVDSALHTFLILYKLDTSNANVAYNIGLLYLQTPAHKAMALPYLEKAGRNVTSKYHPGDPYEKNAPPPAYYSLARAQHLNYQFDNAIENFNKFKKLLSKKDPRQDTIDYWIQCCNNAKELVKTPVDCKVINIGDSINSIYPDYSPVLTADEQTLFFTSRRPALGDSTKDIQGNYYEDVWFSYAKPNGGGWTTAKNGGAPINSAGNDATVSISPDGQTLIMYKDDNAGNGDIYVSYNKGAKWSYPQLIDSNNTGVVNAPGWQPSACLSPDGQTLYFVSNRAGGFGGTDIYKVSLLDNGKWGTPVNLGPDINTKYDEDAPFIHPDDSTMFFSSKGHNSMGGFDVFSATLNAKGQWGNVKNVGHPINTPDDDIYFTLSGDGRRAYYSSVRPGGYGEKDIYEVLFNKPIPVEPVAILVGYIKTPDGSPLPSDVTVTTGLVNGNTSNIVKVNTKTGKFLQVLKPNQNYKVVISSQGKNVYDQNFYLPADSSYLNLSRSFFRTSIVLGDTTNVLSPHKKVQAVVANNTGAMHGRVSAGDTSEQVPVMKIQLVNDKDSVIATTLTDKNGYFTFNKLPLNHDYMLKVDAGDTKLKHAKNLYLADENSHIVRDFDERKKDIYIYRKLPVDLSKLGVLAINDTQVKDKKQMAAKYSKDTASMPKSDADFTRYFAYNIDKVSPGDADFIALVDKIASKAAGGPVTLSISGSASKVPTRAFMHSNKNLAHRRAKETKDAIESALKKKQVDMSKITINVDYTVAGPSYEGDASDQVKYEKFQFVKVYLH